MVAREVVGNGGAPSPAAHPALEGTGQGMVSVAGRKAVVVVLGLRAPGNDRSVVSGTTKNVRPIRAAEVFSDASFPLTTVSGRRSAGGRKAGDAHPLSDASRRSAPDMGLPRLPRSAVSGRRSLTQRQHLLRRTIWSGGAMPVRRPWNRVARFIASGVRPRCAVPPGSCSCSERPRHPVSSLRR